MQSNALGSHTTTLEPPSWTASTLLSLRAECEMHNALDQVTVVKKDGQVHMTSLRQQLASFSHKQLGGLAHVQKDVAAYMGQLSVCFSQHVCPSFSPRSLSPESETPLLFYPFGGIDITSALGLVPSSRCVVFASSEHFGGNAQTISSDFHKLQNFGSEYMRKGMGATLFDSHDDFEHLHQELGLRGVGAMALFRLLGPLQCDVQSLSFFNLDQNGNLIFKSPHLLLQEPCQNVAVWVRAHECMDSPNKLLMFIHHNTHVEDAAVDAFCSCLRPDTLLLKAAPDSLWSCPVHGSRDPYKRCIRRSIFPAARPECIIVSDSCQGDPTMSRQIFKHAPKSVALRDVVPEACEVPHELFGYGERIFWSRGDNFQFSFDDGEIGCDDNDDDERSA